MTSTLRQDRDPQVTQEPANPVPVVMAIVATLGVIASFVPGLWIVAVPLGIASIVVGNRNRSRGRDSDRTIATFVLAAGVIATVFGVLNFGVGDAWFTYFTVEG